MPERTEIDLARKVLKRLNARHRRGLPLQDNLVKMSRRLEVEDRIGDDAFLHWIKNQCKAVRKTEGYSVPWDATPADGGPPKVKPSTSR